MLKTLAQIAAAVAAFGMVSVTTVDAAMIDGIAGAPRIASIEDAQFFFGGRNYCWYDRGWRGPGWYRCGYEFRRGFGWGGGLGWRGWRRPRPGGPGWGGNRPGRPGWNRPGGNRPGGQRPGGQRPSG